MNDKELCQKHLLHAPSMLKEDCPCCQLEAQLAHADLERMAIARIRDKKATEARRRYEKAEAQLDKVRPYMKHKNDATHHCDALKHTEYPCTCGLDSLDQALEKDKGQDNE